MSLVLTTSPQGSGLLALADGLREHLKLSWIATKYAAHGAPAPFVGKTGWKVREQNEASPEGGNRLLLIPGHGTGTSRQHGALELPRHSGIGTPGWNAKDSEGTARTNWTWPRRFTLSVWSYDPRDDRDEELQITASDTLLEMALAGLVAVGRGSVFAAGEIYQDPFSANAPFGIELLVPLVHREPLYALPNDVITDVSVVVQSGQS